MTITSWETLEEQINRALALEMVSTAFPPVEIQNVKGLESDTNRVAAAIRKLPSSFDLSDLVNAVQSTRLGLNYRESMPRTLAHMVAIPERSAIATV